MYGSNANTVALTKSRRKSVVDKKKREYSNMVVNAMADGQQPPRPASSSQPKVLIKQVTTGSMGRARTGSTASSAGFSSAARARSRSAYSSGGGGRGRTASQASAMSSAPSARFRGASDVSERSASPSPGVSPGFNRMATQSTTGSLFSSYNDRSEWDAARPQTADATLRHLRNLKSNAKQNMKEPLTTRLSRPKSATAKFVDRDRSKLTLMETINQPVHDDSDVKHPW